MTHDLRFNPSTCNILYISSTHDLRFTIFFSHTDQTLVIDETRGAAGSPQASTSGAATADAPRPDAPDVLATTSVTTPAIPPPQVTRVPTGKTTRGKLIVNS